MSPRTIISVSLKKCLQSDEYLEPINNMVTRLTWIATNIMWTLNLLVLKHIEVGDEIPPLTRDLFYKVYQKACIPYERKSNNKRKLNADYYNLEIVKIQSSHLDKLYDRKRKRGDKYDDSLLSQVNLNPSEIKKAWKAAYKSDIKRHQEQAAKETGWGGTVDKVVAEMQLKSSWTPMKPLTGESDFVESLIRSELVPNSITYIKETYRSRRRVFIEDQIRQFFTTKSHISRVATEVMRGIDSIESVCIQDSRIDWSGVFSRVRTEKLKASFEAELKSALSTGLDEACLKLITTFPQDLPASTENLELYPHKFIAGLHVMLKATESDGESLPDETDESDDEEDHVVEDFQSASDRVTLRKRFSLLPLRSGRAVFIKLDEKRVRGMRSDLIQFPDRSLGLKWYQLFIDPCHSIKNKKKQALIADSFTTDGVQLKISLRRNEIPEDVLCEKGYHSLSSRSTSDIWQEERGVFILENTDGCSLEPRTRSIIGIDPGVRDVYTSVMTSQGGGHTTHSISNSQWSQTQRTKLIRIKDARWRHATGVSGIIKQMSALHLKTSSYLQFLNAVKLRIVNRQCMWEYQMRRNRRVYRFSSLLARKSAIDRLADAVVQHSYIKPRSDTRSPTDPPDNSQSSPIVAFGGGQFRSGGNGLMSVPRKEIIKHISYRTPVVIVDEYNTSKMCSKCGHRLSDPDLRPHCTTNGPVGQPKLFTKRDKMRLRRCQSEACQRVQSCDGASSSSRNILHMHWNRDVNAAINILNAATEWLESKTRPIQLRRVPEITNCAEKHGRPNGGITTLS